MPSSSHILVFGGRGAVGAAVLRRFAALKWRTTGTTRSEAAIVNSDPLHFWIRCDPELSLESPACLDARAPYSAVCWAQGANTNDSVFDVEPETNIALYRANCLFVIETLRVLLDRGLLAETARLVVVSSIWERIARPQKLSYTMTKAAVGGFVRSASVDLAGRGILINAVLPSALDTPMTAANLSAAQIGGIARATGFGRLTSLDDVVAAIEFLCSSRNTGITGQSLMVDLGYSHAHLV